MKTILASAYAINPYKGSEDGMGWQMIIHLAHQHKVIAITRKNNQEAIERYQSQHPSIHYKNICFLYYDLPYWMRFWKKKSRGAMLYFYLWQCFLPLFVIKRNLKFDIAHNLNFHTDWAPTLLWVFKKPTFWGPVGHHPKIPKPYLLTHYGLISYLKNRLNYMLKLWFWNIDPLVYLSRKKTQHIFCMHSKAQSKIENRRATPKTSLLPSVGSAPYPSSNQHPPKKTFNILSVGRFVPLKGFDVTLESFALFYHQLDRHNQQKVQLTLVGKGPLKNTFEQKAHSLGIKHKVVFIDWIERSELMALYTQASVFLFPSHEGAGMVVSEALSAGLPVLCFDGCGPGEFITEGCGYKIPYYPNYQNAINAFSSKLALLFKEPKQLKELSKGAKARHLNYFTWQRKANHITHYYNLYAQSA